jgi:hypothetical protein
MDDLERRFNGGMVLIYETAKRELGYNATRFVKMISERGGLTTAKQLLWSSAPSEGFTTLWERGRLDLTVEAHVLKTEFAPLFTDTDRDQARDRLESYGWRPPR